MQEKTTEAQGEAMSALQLSLPFNQLVKLVRGEVRIERAMQYLKKLEGEDEKNE